MNINHSEYTIAELVGQYDRKDLIINRKYQRGGGIWPISAQSYFIDTILEKYPFPKMYFYQVLDKAKRRPIMEVVDGQQRLLTIIDFAKNEIKLSGSSQKYAGMKFCDLTEEEQEEFLMFRVPVDVILAARRPELLEMFRRMNAYTAPLNSAEKRHSKYQGKFKWFAVELSDKIGPVLDEWEIFTPKQIIRMADADLIAELVIVLERGIVSKSEADINKLYEKFDENFPSERDYFDFISGFFDFIVNNYPEIRGTHLVKPYAIHSLFCAYAQIRRGIPNGEALGVQPGAGNVRVGRDVSARLRGIADAHETKDVEGEYREYVLAATSTTTKAVQRTNRSRVLAAILSP